MLNLINLPNSIPFNDGEPSPLGATVSSTDNYFHTLQCVSPHFVFSKSHYFTVSRIMPPTVLSYLFSEQWMQRQLPVPKVYNYLR